MVYSAKLEPRLISEDANGCIEARYRVTDDTGGREWFVELVLQPVHAGGGVLRVNVCAIDDTIVTVNSLRFLPLTAMQEEMLGAAFAFRQVEGADGILELENDDGSVTRARLKGFTASPAMRAEAFDMQRRTGPRPGRKPPSDAQVEAFARSYVAGTLAKTHSALSPRQTDHYTRLARERGFLPRTTRGKSTGRLPGPRLLGEKGPNE